MCLCIILGKEKMLVNQIGRGTIVWEMIMNYQESINDVIQL